jgi:type VI secretion system secreted protein VgrG
MSEDDRFAPEKTSVKEKAKLYDNFVDAKKDADKKPKKKAGGTEQKCPLKKEEEKPKIVSVQFLDGDDDTELAGIGKHFVNLPPNKKWVDGTNIQNIDRLSQKTRIKVRFNKSGSHKFKIKYEPGNNNAAYTDTEKGRNDNFKYEDGEKEYTTDDADGTKIIAADFFVTAAGKDEYTLVAKDDYGNPAVKSNKIEMHRLIYYQELKMNSPDVSPLGSMAGFEGEFAKFNIKLARLGRANMEHLKNIGGSDSDEHAFLSSARKAYASSGATVKHPYVVAVAFTDHLAAIGKNVPFGWGPIDVGPGEAPLDLDLTDDNGKKKYLWKGFDDGHDWFVEAHFIEDGATWPENAVNIKKADITPLASSPAKPDKCCKIRIQVANIKRKTGKVKKFLKILGLGGGDSVRTGSIYLSLNCVDRFRGGISFRDGNLICVGTRSFWNARSDAVQVRTIIHEMGHKIGMVVKGTGKDPDKVETWYDKAKGHRGNHCYNGLPDGQARYDNPGDSSSTICVMYGSSNGKTQFCAKCSPAVRKQDLSTGWNPF